MILNLLVYLLTLVHVTHDFHVSRTEIFFNSQEGIIECAAHIFIDDLELGIKHLDTTQLLLGTELEVPKADSLVFAYIKRHNAVTRDGEELNPIWVGKETSEDLSALWIYFYYEWDGDGDLRYYNDVLHEVYGDQKNVVDYEIKEYRSTVLLNSQTISVQLK